MALRGRLGSQRRRVALLATLVLGSALAITGVVVDHRGVLGIALAITGFRVVLIAKLALESTTQISSLTNPPTRGRLRRRQQVIFESALTAKSLTELITPERLDLAADDPAGPTVLAVRPTTAGR